MCRVSVHTCRISMHTTRTIQLVEVWSPTGIYHKKSSKGTLFKGHPLRLLRHYHVSTVCIVKLLLFKVTAIVQECPLFLKKCPVYSFIRFVRSVRPYCSSYNGGGSLSLSLSIYRLLVSSTRLHCRFARHRRYQSNVVIAFPGLVVHQRL